MHQLPIGLLGQCLHKGIGHGDRYIEIIPTPRRTLGAYELQHIRVVDAQHAHLRAPAGACALYGGAGVVKHVDVAARPRGDGGRPFDLRTARADARKVVAHATASAHGFGRFTQGFVNARVAVFVHALNAVAYRLHKAIDQRGVRARARCTHDAPGANRAVF